MIERNKKITIGNKSFVVVFPNIGQILDIESMKQALTNNRYGVMVQSGLKSAYYALDIVDAVSFIQIVTPEISRYYDISNYLTMSPDKVQEFVKVYQEQIKPWYDEVMLQLQNPLNNDEGMEKEKQS
jgi:hypothetical protein